MGRFLDIIREVQSERVTNIINTCNEGMGLCICTNNVLEHGVAYIWKKLINLNCDVVAVALSKKSTGEPEVFRVFEMGMALSQTKFLPLLRNIGHCIVGINLPHGPIIVISQSNSIIYTPFWRILYLVHVWYGDLIPKWKGPIIVISESKSILFLYWPFLENIVSCAYHIWYGDLIAEWDGPIIVISQRKLFFFIGPFWRILSLVSIPRKNFNLNWLT